MNNGIESFNDGLLIFLQKKDNINSFGAQKNSRSKNDFIKKGSSFFKEETRRTQDFEFAEGLNHKLTLKVKIPYRTGISNDLKIMIDNYLYDLIHYDYDRKKREIYLYLEGIGFFE
mgnify:CR=1 FL=1|nr:MAG TPA: head tail joining protein [Caudoviricetes sp.]